MTEEKAANCQMRVMTPADVPFGMSLKNITKWNQLPADWERFIALEPQGCFVAVLDGEDVGTISTTSYGSKLAWIGMVLVPPVHRRKGIGSALLKRAVTYLQEKKVEVIGLDATPLGNKLYLTLGFWEDFALERWQGVGNSLRVDGVAPMAKADLDAVIDFDAPRFGVPRPDVLGRLYTEYPQLCWTVKDGGKLCGYLMMRPGMNAHQIGPWIASDPDAAEVLFRSALNVLPGKPVFLDVVVPNFHAMAIVKKYDFTLQRPFVRMFLGDNKYPADTDQMFAISGVEKG